MKAFFSSIVLLSLVLGLIQAYSAGNVLAENTEEMKNLVITSQRISEKQYSMQHSFENAARESLKIMPENANDLEKSLIICEKIKELDFTVRPGCINGDYAIDEAKTAGIELTDVAFSLVRKDYFSVSENALSALEPCVRFVREENGKIIVGLNTKIDLKNSINLCDSGFLLEDEMGGSKVREIIASGTEIK